MQWQRQDKQEQGQRTQRDCSNQQNAPASLRAGPNLQRNLLLNILDRLGVLLVLALALIKGPAPQEKSLDQTILRQAGRLRAMLMFQFDQAREEFFVLRVCPRLELFVPPVQRAVLEFRDLAGGEHACLCACRWLLAHPASPRGA